MALHAEGQLAVDQLAAQRVGRRRLDRRPRATRDSGGPSSMGRPRPSRTRPSRPSPTTHGQGPTECLDGVAVADAGEVAEGHAGQGGALDGDHLGVEDAAAAPDPDRLADGGGDALDLDAQPDQPGDPARATRAPRRPATTSAAGGARRS